MRKIAVFDFDGTLYTKDSSIEITKYIYSRFPLRAVYIFPQLLFLLLYKLRLIDKTKLKEKFCVYLWNIPPDKLSELILAFWKKEYPTKFRKYLLEKISHFHANDVEVVCVSASPEIFLSPVCEILKIKLIGTQLVYHSPKYIIEGINCRGKEKISQLFNRYEKQSAEIVFACSDNLDDKELLELAQERIFINKGE